MPRTPQYKLVQQALERHQEQQAIAGCALLLIGAAVAGLVLGFVYGLLHA